MASNSAYSSAQIIVLHMYAAFHCPGVHKILYFWIVIKWIQLVGIIQGPNTFFLENAEKQLIIFSNFFFYLKVQYFHLIMENNFIHASTSHAVAYMIGQIFKHIIDCVQLYFTNGFTNIVL